MPGLKDAPANVGPDDVSVRNFRLLVAMVQAHGLDVASFLASIGLRTEDLFDSTARVPAAIWHRAWELAMRETSLPDLGIRAAAPLDETTIQMLSTGTEYLLVRLLTNSETVGEGLRRVARYFAVSDASFCTTFETGPGGVGRFRLRPAGQGPVPVGPAEYAVATLLRLAFGAASQPIVPAAVLFPHPRQSPSDSYERTLRVPPRFEAGELGFDFAAADLSVALRTTQPSALPELEARANELLDARASAATWAARVRAAVEQDLAAGKPQITRLAARLGVSSRTLARHLLRERTSFQAEVDRVRTAAAQERLSRGLPVKQVAAELGYADTSTFVRAFRRWTGKTPTQHRAPKR